MKKLFTLAIVAMIASMAFAQKSVKSNLGTPTMTKISANAALKSKGGMMKAPETEPVWGNWTKESTGNYSHKILWDVAYDYDVQVRYATNVENLAQVRIIDWVDDGVDLFFEWNTSTNVCSLPAQDSGWTGKYGTIFIGDIAAWNEEPALAEMYPSTYDPATMTFSLYVAYFVSEGAYGMNIETLQLNAPLQDITHAHDYGEWLTDETNHWYACSSDEGECEAPVKDKGAHVYATAMTSAAYYTCSTCHYEDADRKEECLTTMAEPVIALINAIGTVSDSYATAKAISDARIAYDNLIAPAKAYVTNYDDLVAAETLYNQMVSFDSYRNSRSWLLGIRLTQFDNAEVRRQVADAAQKIQALKYVEELTLEENKKRVDDIYNTYLDILKKSRHDVVVADLLEVAKHNGKASIMLFVAASDSQRAIDAANEGIAKIDALEYDYEADLSANLDDVFDIVIDTKINIVNAWKADFEDLKAEIIKKIQEILGIGSQAEAKVAGMSYEYSLTREENNAKLNDVMQSIGGTTGINAVNAASAKNGKYVENGKIVIVKNGKAYTAAGQMK